MNALQLLKQRELRVQLRNNSKKAVARGPESSDYTSAHLSPVKLTKEKAINPSCLLVINLMATVDEPGLLLEQIQKNGQHVLRRKIFRVNRWQLIPYIQIRH